MIPRILVLSLMCLTLHSFARRMAPIKRDLLDGTYTIVKLRQDDKLKTITGIKSKITCNSEEKSITAHFGCNKMSGELQTSNNAILPVHLMSTEMFCNDKINQIESNFGLQMEAATRFTIKGTIITLYKNEHPIIVLKKVVTKKK